MSQAPIDELLLAKFRAFPGVLPGLSYDATLRAYFILRSGVMEDKDVPISFYMHTTFDNLALPEGMIDYRMRHMFILESAATNADPWSAAARTWALTP